MPDDDDQQPTGDPGDVKASFTQDQVNHFTTEARRRALGGFFKEVGLDKALTPDEMKALIAKGGKFDEQQQGQQGDVERLTGQLGEANKKADRVPVLEIQYRRAEIAADMGLRPNLWKFVEGDGDDDIKTSVQEILDEFKPGGSGGDDGQQQRSGLRPNFQQGSGGGARPPKPTMAMGAEAFKAKHNLGSSDR